MDYQQLKLDREQCSKDSRVTNSLENGEYIVLSTSLWKFSYVNKQQRRILLITNKNVYNITPQSAITNFFSKVVSSLRVKRKIAISNISGVTLSKCGYEFIIHVPDEYDYRYSSLDFRDKIIQVLADYYCRIHKRKFAIHLKDDLNLVPYCTTKVDGKKGIRKQCGNPIYMDANEVLNADFCQLQLYAQDANEYQIERQLNECTLLYSPLKGISQGNLGVLLLSQNLRTNQLCVVKCLSKQDIITTDHLCRVKAERQLLELFDHPFIIKLNQAFESEDKIFFVLPFYQGGDIYNSLLQDTRFKEDRVKFYAAMLTSCFGYIHQQDYVYRDLKPENILIDQQGYIALTDFGLCKYLQSASLAYSLVGTVEYLAPEMIIATGYGRMIDWWMLGILIYELLIGITPFYSDNQSQIFESIQEKEVKFPSTIPISSECKDFIVQILKKDPKDRLGFRKDSQEIMSHPWFKDINFTDLSQRKLQAPWKPTLTDQSDLRYFEPFDFQQDMLYNPQFDKLLIQKFNKEFGRINYKI